MQEAPQHAGFSKRRGRWVMSYELGMATARRRELDIRNFACIACRPIWSSLNRPKAVQRRHHWGV